MTNFPSVSDQIKVQTGLNRVQNILVIEPACWIGSGHICSLDKYAARRIGGWKTAYAYGSRYGMDLYAAHSCAMIQNLAISHVWPYLQLI